MKTTELQMKQADKFRPGSTVPKDSGLGQDLTRLAFSVRSAIPQGGPPESAGRETSAHSPQELLQDPQRFLDSLLGSLPGTVYRCTNDPQWTMLFLSANCQQLTGYAPEDLIDNNKVCFGELIHPDDRDRVWKGMQQAIKQRRPHKLKYRILAPSCGEIEEKWIVQMGAGVYSPSGELLALEGLLQEINKQKTLERSVQRLRGETAQLRLALRRQEEDIEVFSFMCAHNLREPLRHVNVFSHLLEKQAGPSLPQTAKGHLSAIIRAADRMSQRIADVQSLVFATRISLMRQAVPLAECVMAALESLKPLIERSEAEIQVEALPTVIGDPILLTHLFEHLLNNAMRFSGPQPQIEVTARKKGDGWVFGVKDNGPGIDPRYHTRIFRPFEKLNAARSPIGNGMGLAICQSIVNRHEGKLWLWSEPGKGAHFQFTLALPAEPSKPVV